MVICRNLNQAVKYLGTISEQIHNHSQKKASPLLLCLADIWPFLKAETGICYRRNKYLYCISNRDVLCYLSCRAQHKGQKFPLFHAHWSKLSDMVRHGKNTEAKGHFTSTKHSFTHTVKPQLLQSTCCYNNHINMLTLNVQSAITCPTFIG